MVSAQPYSWIDRRAGWIALVAAVLVVVVTVVYVWFTRRANRMAGQAAREAHEANHLALRAIREAQDANSVALQAISSSQDANERALQALDNDQRQYALAVKNQQDAAMPAVVIQFKGANVRRPTLARYITDDIGTVDRDEFAAMLLVIDASFDVMNHGPGPALLSVEVTSEYETQALRLVVTTSDYQGQTFAGNRMVELAGDPILIPASDPTNLAIITVRTVTSGRELFSRICGTVYAKVRFRWSAYVQRDVYDSATMDLRAGVDIGGSGPVNDAFLRRLFLWPSESPQRSDLLLPGDRYYRPLS